MELRASLQTPVVSCVRAAARADEHRAQDGAMGSRQAEVSEGDTAAL